MNYRSTLYVVADVETQEIVTLGSESSSTFSGEAAEARAKAIAATGRHGIAVYACDGVNPAQQVTQVF
jgi:hypothetical protein